MGERQSRADRWIDGAYPRAGTAEPEWWLRMQCGQLAEEYPAAHYAGMRPAIRRAVQRLTQPLRPRPSRGR
jgi:hypothetical protein